VSRINDLLRHLRATNEALAADIEREIAALQDRRAFGLNFERHVPEAVELPGRRVRKGDKVRVLPPRGRTPKQADEKLWRVASLDRSSSKALLEPLALGTTDEGSGWETLAAAIEDLVVVAEFRDPAYPGLVSTGKVLRGGDKPFHTVINAENFHALQTLLFTHRGMVDCIYIDPPYNTGARDWKYNNDYVESDDLYRHSKWLAMMERRLLLAKELLNPGESVLVVTIDEKEYLRLGLLLEQTFPESNIQMVSITISPRGTNRPREFSRVDEYAFFVFIGSAVPGSRHLRSDGDAEVRWQYLRRDNGGSERSSGRPNQFYPIYVATDTDSVASVGPPVAAGESRLTVVPPAGTVAVFPVKADGTEMVWGLTAPALEKLVDGGFIRLTRSARNRHQLYTISFVSGLAKNLAAGVIEVAGERDDGSKVVVVKGGHVARTSTVWREASHDAGAYGTSLLGALIPGRRFPFPKSLYAVEDSLRVIVGEKPSAVILDFFSGSGTTAHAVMRLNKQDDGRRQCIVVTNNEVSADEQKGLRDEGLRPGDAEWEALGICEHVTKPRIEAAITGKTPAGEPITGDYKFGDEFPMADGFEENVEFFTLTYEAPLRVASNREFEKIAPLLWLRAGARGRRIEDVSPGWDVADVYGVLIDLDHTEAFLKAVAASADVAIVFVVTDEDRLFESVSRDLPDHVEPVRLYEAYLRNFEIESGRGSL
jgi:adenine-specific DNA-methyltransferase